MTLKQNWFLVALMFLGLCLVGAMDADDEQQSENEYCAMVKTWKQDEAKGIEKNERAGWPPFKGEEFCK